jgi:hypothetical protein
MPYTTNPIDRLRPKRRSKEKRLLKLLPISLAPLLFQQPKRSRVIATNGRFQLRKPWSSEPSLPVPDEQLLSKYDRDRFPTAYFDTDPDSDTDVENNRLNLPTIGN